MNNLWDNLSKEYLPEENRIPNFLSINNEAKPGLFDLQTSLIFSMESFYFYINKTSEKEDDIVILEQSDWLTEDNYYYWPGKAFIAWYW